MVAFKKKPSGPLVLDRSNRLLRGALFVSLDGRSNLLLKDVASETAGAVFERGAVTLAASAARVEFADRAEWDRPNETNEITVAVVYRANWDSLSGTPKVIQRSGPGADQFELRISSGGDRITPLVYYTAGSQNFNTPADSYGGTGPNPRDWHLLGLFHDASDLGAFVDGEIYTQTKTAGTLNTSARPLELGDAGTNSSAYGEIALSAFWDRRLSDAEIKALARDPWQMFKPARPSLYVVPGAAGPTAYTLTAESGSFTVTGTDVDLLRGLTMAAETTAFTLTGTDADLLRSYTVDAESASFILTGTDADLLRSYTVDAEPASFILTGTDAGLLYGARLDAESGTFTLTGTDVDLFVGSVLVADSGTYTFSGTDAGLLYGARLDAESGTFTLTGTDAALDYSGAAPTLNAESGTFTLTGTDANLHYSALLDAESGTFTLTGTDAGLFSGVRLDAESGTFTLTGTAIDLPRAAAISAEAGSYILTGTSNILSYSQETDIGPDPGILSTTVDRSILSSTTRKSIISS